MENDKKLEDNIIISKKELKELIDKAELWLGTVDSFTATHYNHYKEDFEYLEKWKKRM